MRLFNDNTDITDGIDSNVWRAINKAIDKNSFESFRVLKSFVRHVIQISVRNNSLKHFQKYIFFHTYYYSISYEKAKRNAGLSEMYKSCSLEAAMQLKEIIWFEVNFIYKSKKSIENLKSANFFYYWAFQEFSKLLFYMLKNGDINQFRLAINEFEQISEKNSYEQKQLKKIIRGSFNGQNDDFIKLKKKELKILKQFNNYKRHVLIGIKYWMFFLYKEDKIEEDTVLQFLKIIQIPYIESDDRLSDILFFRGGLGSYMGWSEWDYEERLSGKVYSLPQPEEWMTAGFFIDQIKEKRSFVNVSELDSEDISQTNLLFHDLKLNSEYFEDNFEKWENVLDVHDLENYKEKSKDILKDFVFKGKAWEDGSVYDPNNGKTYSCNMKLKSTDELEIRGFIGFSLLGRTTVWTKVK